MDLEIQPHQAASVEAVSDNAHEGISVIERANIDMQISTARRFPRALSKVKSDMLTFATLDEDTAASCFYTLPRGGKTIQGPSVRLAEIAISCYGNMRAGSRVVSVETGEHPHVTVQAVCHDLEKNTCITVEKRRRITKKKHKADIDEDDINLAANAGSSIALRDAVFKVVPLALIKPVMDQAKQVAIGNATSLAGKRAKCFERLQAMGATPETILARVSRAKIDDVTLADLEVLIGLGSALKDGQTTLEEAFPKNSPPINGGISAATAQTQQHQGTATEDGSASASEPSVGQGLSTADALRAELAAHGVSAERLLTYAKSAKLAGETITDLFVLADPTLAKLKLAVRALKTQPTPNA